MASVLVLWDIDHTLLETRGVGGEIYAEAFAKVTGHPLRTMPRLAGRTEPVIFQDAMKANGIDDTDGLYERFAAEQARGYANRVGELRRRGRALPGAADALRALAGYPDVAQSVLTGNTRPSSEIKIQAFGLDDHLDFGIGAYGTDDDIRANLVAIARQRAEQAHGHPYTAADTVLIGDTPNDVTAALDGGARIIAVATGKNTAAELTSAGAGIVLQDLTDTSSVVTAVLGARA